MNVTVLGTGNMARAIASRMIAGGNNVTFYSRDPGNAWSMVQELAKTAPRGTSVRVIRLGDPISDPVVFNTISYAAALDVLKGYAAQLGGKILVDISNPPNPTFDDPATPPGTSSAEEIAKVVPQNTPVVKAFNTTFAEPLPQGHAGSPLNVFITGDDAAAKATVAGLIEKGGLRAFDAGPLKRALHPSVEVGTVSLKVADLQRSIRFYTEIIGLALFKQEGRTAWLGAGARRILTLEEITGAKPLARNTTGLYHAAILFPDRRSLALKMAHIASIRYPFGQSDHLVSEAFYISDPDDNGLELYRDRPRSEWTWENGKVKMAIDPIDFESFFAGIQGSDVSSGIAAPDGTKLGHMHLRVPDIPLAEAFYHGVLGFDVTARMPGALFVSAGGYHHHLGMNTWESLGAKPPVEPSAGLREFSISLPNRGELERLVKQVEAAGVPVEQTDDTALVLDPFQNRVGLVLSKQLEET